MSRAEVLQGTLDLMVLKTLDAAGEMHGYGIAQQIQLISRDILSLNQGTLYPALLRLTKRHWIQARWGKSQNNRRARFYRLTDAGRSQLVAETENWRRMVGIMQRLLDVPGHA